MKQKYHIAHFDDILVKEKNEEKEMLVLTKNHPSLRTFQGLWTLKWQFKDFPGVKEPVGTMIHCQRKPKQTSIDMPLELEKRVLFMTNISKQHNRFCYLLRVNGDTMVFNSVKNWFVAAIL